MKFAFCLYQYFPFGGAQRNFMRIAIACQKRGHDVSVYASKWVGEKPENIPVHIVPSKGWSNHQRMQSFGHHLKEKLRGKQYDCVLAPNKIPGLDIYYGSDICYLESTQKNHGIFYRLTPRYRTYAALEKSVFGKDSETHVLLLCEKQKKEYLKHYDTPEERLHILPPNLDKNQITEKNLPFLRKQMRQKHHITKEQTIVLMVGSSFNTKGVDRAIRSIAALPEELKSSTQLWIVGKGKPESYKKLAQKLGVSEQVIFIGASREVPAFLAAADLLIHPARKENTGTSLLEALLASLPVLTTETCGFAPYIEKAKAGVVLSLPFDQSLWNQALIDILHSPLKQRTFRKNAANFAKHADFSSNTDYIVDLIEKICAIKKKTR